MASSAAAVRPKTELIDVSPPAKPLKIDPDFVTMNHAGGATRTWWVRLPEGMTADDLKSPEIWSPVQRRVSKAIRKFDSVAVVAFDESWIAEAIVADADGGKVVLAKPKITNFPPRFDKLFEDSLYRVKWYGNGFGVERKTDGLRMTPIVANAPIAERDLVRLYPEQV